MSVIYLETSALLTWLFGESRGKTVLNVIQESASVYTSVLTNIEVDRAVIRAERSDLINTRQAQAMRGLFIQTLASWTTMEISSEIQDRARKPFSHEPVRSLDAIHLATAIAFLKISPNLRVLSFDQRILQNLKHLNIDFFEDLSV